jgi:putative ABC transport system permease protein
VVGILKRTGTPVDRTLHISLGGMEAIHIDWHNGVPAQGAGRITADQARNMDLTPTAITAFMLGLNNKISTFALQREINEFRGEPMLAILPGVALQELWSLMGTAEKALFVISLFVVLTGLIGMLTAILTSLNERRREMAILRSVGARPWHIASLLILEAFALALAGAVSGLALLYVGIAAAQGYVQANYGLYLPLSLPSAYEWTLLGGILGAALLMGVVPAWRAYRQSLADGLSIRL